eukprot:MONOS_726.1-p1 / transcript=MONOS_726.1 / gene=MONOS_726 / organism=Monocercomonoides_exilis_PA203 / gene_product=unspecified product / transcript_product=unspecified product / location=Mono_scaffold00012:106773-112133(-) / protein_length=1693 / sequence_SO=supercontig / SO=protein_coding / is_pseudo=false
MDEKNFQMSQEEKDQTFWKTIVELQHNNLIDIIGWGSGSKNQSPLASEQTDFLFEKDDVEILLKMLKVDQLRKITQTLGNSPKGLSSIQKAELIKLILTPPKQQSILSFFGKVKTGGIEEMEKEKAHLRRVVSTLKKALNEPLIRVKGEYRWLFGFLGSLFLVGVRGMSEVLQDGAEQDVSGVDLSTSQTRDPNRQKWAGPQQTVRESHRATDEAFSSVLAYLSASHTAAVKGVLIDREEDPKIIEMDRLFSDALKLVAQKEMNKPGDESKADDPSTPQSSSLPSILSISTELPDTAPLSTLLVANELSLVNEDYGLRELLVRHFTMLFHQLTPMPPLEELADSDVLTQPVEKSASSSQRAPCESSENLITSPRKRSSSFSSSLSVRISDSDNITVVSTLPPAPSTTDSSSDSKAPIRTSAAVRFNYDPLASLRQASSLLVLIRMQRVSYPHFTLSVLLLTPSVKQLHDSLSSITMKTLKEGEDEQSALPSSSASSQAVPLSASATRTSTLSSTASTSFVNSSHSADWVVKAHHFRSETVDDQWMLYRTMSERILAETAKVEELMSQAEYAEEEALAYLDSTPPPTQFVESEQTSPSATELAPSAGKTISSASLPTQKPSLAASRLLDSALSISTNTSQEPLRTLILLHQCRSVFSTRKDYGIWECSRRVVGAIDQLIALCDEEAKEMKKFKEKMRHRENEMRHVEALKRIELEKQMLKEGNIDIFKLRRSKAKKMNAQKQKKNKKQKESEGVPQNEKEDEKKAIEKDSEVISSFNSFTKRLLYSVVQSVVFFLHCSELSSSLNSNSLLPSLSLLSNSAFPFPQLNLLQLFVSASFRHIFTAEHQLYGCLSRTVIPFLERQQRYDDAVQLIEWMVFDLPSNRIRKAKEGKRASEGGLRRLSSASVSAATQESFASLSMRSSSLSSTSGSFDSFDANNAPVYPFSRFLLEATEHLSSLISRLIIDLSHLGRFREAFIICCELCRVFQKQQPLFYSVLSGDPNKVMKASMDEQVQSQNDDSQSIESLLSFSPDKVDLSCFFQHLIISPPLFVELHTKAIELSKHLSATNFARKNVSNKTVASLNSKEKTRNLKETQSSLVQKMELEIQRKGSIVISSVEKSSQNEQKIEQEKSIQETSGKTSIAEKDEDEKSIADKDIVLTQPVNTEDAVIDERLSEANLSFDGKTQTSSGLESLKEECSVKRTDSFGAFSSGKAENKSMSRKSSKKSEQKVIEEEIMSSLPEIESFANEIEATLLSLLDQDASPLSPIELKIPFKSFPRKINEIYPLHSSLVSLIESIPSFNTKSVNEEADAATAGSHTSVQMPERIEFAGKVVKMDAELATRKMKGKSIFVDKGGAGMTVEQFALNEYRLIEEWDVMQEGATNSLMNTIVTLLLWDLIFSEADETKVDFVSSERNEKTRITSETQNQQQEKTAELTNSNLNFTHLIPSDHLLFENIHEIDFSKKQEKPKIKPKRPSSSKSASTADHKKILFDDDNFYEWTSPPSLLPTVFMTPFQTSPLDYSHPLIFALRRSSDLLSRLSFISSLSDFAVGHLVCLEYMRHKDERCIGMRGDLFERDELGCIASALGGRVLAVICLMMTIYGNSMRCGFPDLVFCRMRKKSAKKETEEQSILKRKKDLTNKKDIIPDDNEKECEVKFVEVKGPRDHLSFVQIVWMNLLLAFGVDVELCRVNEG